MSDLIGQSGELAFTIQIKRKETGLVEEHHLVGKITADQAEQLGINVKKESNDGNDPLDGGA